MGQRGPAPQPVALKLLKGETRPSRVANSPKDQDPPQKPADLSPEASAEWDRVLSVTTHIGEPDAQTLRHYCEATAAANSWNPKGTKEWQNLVTIHMQLATKLCLTPATSGSRGAATKPRESKLAKYVKAG